MVQRRDLNAPPGRRLADVIREAREAAESSKTGAHGEKDMGETGEQKWTDPETGAEHSARELPGLIDEARETIEAAEGDIEAAKQAIADERAAREAALADAQAALDDLDERLNAAPDDEALQAIRDDLAAARAEVEAAAGVADDAAAAAATANANALAAAGIAADKGRIIYAPEKPTDPDDQSTSNLWIDSDNGRVYVWDETAGDWIESENESLRDAAQAAAAALQAAEAADAKASDAADSAAAAQAAAEAAQTTADEATIDARDAHNAAVDAQAAVDAKIAAGESLVLNGSFESGDLGWPAGRVHGGRSGIIADPDARTGSNVLRLAPDTANAYPESDFVEVEPGRVLRVRGWFKHLGGDGYRVGLLVRYYDASRAYLRVLYATVATDVQSWTVGEWSLLEGEIEVPEDTRWLRFAFHATGPSTSVYHADDLQVLDVTDARSAQARAEEAYALADGKPDMSDVEVAIETSANGKNSITVSSAAPTGSTPGVVAGDTWWRVDGDGVIFAQYRWTGSAWSPVTVRSEVIASLDVGKLVVTGSSRFTEAVVDRLFADLFTAHKITAEQITIAALDENGDLAPGSVGAITLQDGIVGADKIIADEVAVAVADLVKARVENLVVTDGATINEAVILKLAAEMITSGVLRTAEAGQRVVIDETGIVMIGVDADGIEFELVRIGPAGDNLITAGDTMISPAGVQAPNGTFDDLTVGGESLPAILEAYPRGIVAHGWIKTNSSYDADTSLRARRGELQTVMYPDRTYRIRLSEHYLQTSASSARVKEYLHYSIGGIPIPRGSIAGTGVVEGMWARHYLNGGDVYVVPGTEFTITTGGFSGPQELWIMYSIQTESASWPVRLVAGEGYPLELSVEDIGPAVQRTLKRWNDNDGGAAQDPEPVIKRYTKTYTSNGFRTYDNNGSQTSDADVVQGLFAGGSSSRLRKGGWLFPSMTGDLAGATVEKVEAYIYMNHSYYTAGAIVNPCVWGGIMRDNLDPFTQVTGWKRNTGKWFTLPSSLHAGFKSGKYAGIGVKPTTTYAEQYARFNGAGAKIRITYTK